MIKIYVSPVYDELSSKTRYFNGHLLAVHSVQQSHQCQNYTWLQAFLRIELDKAQRQELYPDYNISSVFSRLSLRTVYSGSHPPTTLSGQQTCKNIYCHMNKSHNGLNLAIFNPSVEVHVLDDSRELVSIGRVAG